MNRWLRIPLVVFALILLIALGGTVIMGLGVLNLEGNAIQQLVIAMSGSGVLTTLASFGLYRSGLLTRLPSILWTLGVMVAFVVALVFINMWVLAQMMFISSAYLNITSTMLVFSGLTALTFGYFIARAMTDRLRDLSAGARTLASGDLQHQLPVNGNDEIAQLTAHFNQMAQDLSAVDAEKRKLEQTRRDLIAWVSHDLRTPMTSIRVMLEAIADGIIRDDDTRNRYIQTSLGEIEHLNTLIDDLFELAKLDVQDIQLDYMPTHLSDLISDTVSGISPKAHAKDLHIHTHIPPDLPLVTLAPDKIQRVLSNLLDNAVKYTPAHEMIRITVTHEREQVQVSIANSGIHIPPEQLPKLFDSFYRGESSRAQQNGERGTGLGLAIAKGFIQAHGGRIWAESEANLTHFHFQLPLTPPPQRKGST